MNKAMKEDKAAEELLLHELPGGESKLRQTADLIYSLICLSHSVKAFPAKWQSIRVKLEQLNSSLISAENCNSGENPPFSDIIQCIFSTAIECHDLARRCINLSYSGKLLMHSDLDIILAKFDLHLNDLTQIYTSGILTNTCAMVVPRPVLGAGLKDMKFYVRDLSSRLKIGDYEMKRQALIALNEILRENDKYVRLVVEAGEIVGLLINFLEFGELGIQEESAHAVSVIASFNSYKGILVNASVIAPLIRVLEVGSELGKENAARALDKLTQNSDNAWSVSAHGGVTVLLKICRDNNANREMINSACSILRNLASVDEIRRFMIEEGAISASMELLRSKDEVLQIRSIEFLQTIACGDETARQMVMREGGIRLLIRVLDPRSSFSSKMREIAMRTIDNLCFTSPSSINALLGSEFLNWVLFFIRNGDISIQESAAKTAFRLCGISEAATKVMGDAGFLPVLVKLLDAKSSEIRELAAEALAKMVSIPRNRKRFIQEDSNVVRVLQLLNPDDSSTNKYFLSLLISLTNSHTARRKIASSSYLKHLETLSEAGVTDAKRIIRKLSENRFRSILSGIWNA